MNKYSDSRLSTRALANGVTASFGYDHASNITTYTWTDDDQLAAVALPNGGGTITNTYNGDGLRFSRTDANGTNSFAWNGKVLDAQLGAGNTVSTWYTQGMGEYGDIISTRDASADASSLQLYDASGNVNQTTDASANITATLSYGSFGNVTDNSGPANPTVAWQGKQGYQFEHPLGLQYVRQRWYDPATGQFISPDPLGFGGGDVNLYRYAGNNPINRNDPGGEQAWPGGNPGSAMRGDALTALMLSQAALQLRAYPPQAGGFAPGYLHELERADMDVLHALEQSDASTAPYRPQHPAIGQAMQLALAAFGPRMQQALHGMQQSYVPLSTQQLHTNYLWAHRHETQIPMLVAHLKRDLAAVETMESFLKLRLGANMAKASDHGLPGSIEYVHATEALLKVAIGFVGHRWGAYQTQQNAFQGGYFHSREQDIQGLVMAMRMIPGGEEAYDIQQHRYGWAGSWFVFDTATLGWDSIFRSAGEIGHGAAEAALTASREADGARGPSRLLWRTREWWAKSTLNYQYWRGLSLSDKFFYEVGQKTLPTELLKASPDLLRLNPVERGRWFVENQGLGRALWPYARGVALGAGATLHTGATPAFVWLLRSTASGGIAVGWGYRARRVYQTTPKSPSRPPGVVP